MSDWVWGEAIGFDLGFEGFGVVMHSDLVQRERERVIQLEKKKRERTCTEVRNKG